VSLARRLTIATLAALVSSGVAAQSIQRCEGARGTVTYANGPCPAGTTAVREVNTAPAISVSDQKSARERATRDAKQLERLQRERKAEENKAEKVRADAARKEEARQRECRKLAGRVESARDVAGSATLAQRTDAERKLRRAQDQYTRDCGG
jgi:hypothetical protein